jgi:signal transduction histidine kinase
MRSLTAKLTLAFLFVSVIGVVLVAIFVSRQTQREFNRYVLSSYQLELLDDITAYYRQSGSWSELTNIEVRGPFRGYGRGPIRIPAPLTLVDDSRTVIYGGAGHQAGQIVDENELRQAAPVEVDGEEVGWVLFAESDSPGTVPPESPASQFLQNLNQAVILGASGAIFVALLVGTILARTISRPVREVTKATQLVAGGDLGYQVPVRTRDEIGELAASFNRMSADLAQSNRQRRQMTADIAHDLRTPLSVILGYIEALNSGKLQPTSETFEIMYSKGQHLQHLIEDLRILALVDAGELMLTRRAVEPKILLEHTALAHMIQAQEKGIKIRVEVGDGTAEFEIDSERMSQVLGNLVSNALRYTPEGGEIVLSAKGDEKESVLEVRDNGAGIASEELPHIFDRFYRSDNSRRQSGESGLGLAIAKSIVTAHGGSISVSSTVGEGTTFTIRIPYSQ